VLNLLCDVFRRSQNVADNEFIAKLEQGGVEYTLRRLDTATVIEIGRYCCRFDEQDKSAMAGLTIARLIGGRNRRNGRPC
jgi:hypothetical protein